MRLAVALALSIALSACVANDTNSHGNDCAPPGAHMGIQVPAGTTADVGEVSADAPCIAGLVVAPTSAGAADVIVMADASAGSSLITCHAHARLIDGTELGATFVLYPEVGGCPGAVTPSSPIIAFYVESDAGSDAASDATADAGSDATADVTNDVESDAGSE